MSRDNNIIRKVSPGGNVADAMRASSWNAFIDAASLSPERPRRNNVGEVSDKRVAGKVSMDPAEGVAPGLVVAINPEPLFGSEDDENQFRLNPVLKQWRDDVTAYRPGLWGISLGCPAGQVGKVAMSGVVPALVEIPLGSEWITRCEP